MSVVKSMTCLKTHRDVTVFIKAVLFIFSAILGDTAIVSGQEEDLHLSDDEDMDVNDSESSPVCTT